MVAEVGRVLTSGKVTAKIFNDDTSKNGGTLGVASKLERIWRDPPFRED